MNFALDWRPSSKPGLAASAWSMSVASPWPASKSPAPSRPCCWSMASPTPAAAFRCWRRIWPAAGWSCRICAAMAPRKPDRELSGLADFADDIAGLIGRLRLDRPVLVGHSLGAMVAVEAAARHGELIGGLVLLAGTLKPGILAGSSDGDRRSRPCAIRSRRPTRSMPGGMPAGPACRRPSSPLLAQEASTMPAARWRSILEQLRRADLTDRAPERAAGDADRRRRQRSAVRRGTSASAVARLSRRRLRLY